MYSDQINRIAQALSETCRLLDVYESRKTFDRHQEAERVKQVEFYKAHIAKLEGMLADARVAKEAA